MALDAQALVSVAELKDFLGLAGSNRDNAVERAINAASSIIATHLGRKLCDSSLGTPWERTEYHSLDCYSSELWLADWPAVSITKVYEDATRGYGVATEVAATGYVIDKAQGRLFRVQDGGGRIPWAVGFEAVKVVGLIGYRGQKEEQGALGEVPSDIKDSCLFVASRLYQEADKKQFDVSSMTDATGTVQRFSGSRLPPMIAERLASHRARPSTGRRAA